MVHPSNPEAGHAVEVLGEMSVMVRVVHVSLCDREGHKVCKANTLQVSSAVWYGTHPPT